ncbi:tetratricopeptide repeat protein [Sphingoaurantiacus capsulatus]|uniref:Tetratricopeptide repeat protein n=1 Tax=Sphingoaurantiacus capsulatus TaxID=1771310 RepID=A0ABV7XIF4_9SPHN
MASLSTAAGERASIEAFRRDVLDASMDALVILQFTAEWCGPCKALNPILDKVAADYADKGVRRVAVDVDKNQTIAAQFRIQSVPTIYAIFQGQPVADLTPARTEPQLKQYLDQILAQLPIGAGAEAAGAADIEPLIEAAQAALAEGAYEEAHRIFTALAAEVPERMDVVAGIARALIGLGRIEEAQGVMAGVPEDAKDAGVAQARASLALAKEATPVDDLDGLRARSAAAPDDLALRYELAGGLMARGDHDAAADELLESIRIDRTWNEGAARDRLLKLFEAVGLEDPWVMATRRKLSTILFS